jgi:hypothetical protein
MFCDLWPSAKSDARDGEKQVEWHGQRRELGTVVQRGSVLLMRSRKATVAQVHLYPSTINMRVCPSLSLFIDA